MEKMLDKGGDLGNYSYTQSLSRETFVAMFVVFLGGEIKLVLETYVTHSSSELTNVAQASKHDNNFDNKIETCSQ